MAAAVQPYVFRGPCDVTLANVTPHHDNSCCKGLLNGHAIIIVRERNTNHFGYYHIGQVNRIHTWSLQYALGNTQGTIESIIADELEDEIGYQIVDSKVWESIPSERINTMVKHIYEQQAEILKKPIDYQKGGNQRWFIWGGNRGHSCITWALEKLRYADLEIGKTCINSSKTPVLVSSKSINTINVTTALTAVAAIAITAIVSLKKT